MNLGGWPIEIRYRDNLSDTAGNPAHAATFIRRRLIVLDHELRRNPPEHARILMHELAHFIWVRTGNEKRRAWEALLRAEWQAKARGEAGWRKRELSSMDVKHSSRKWRDYCCESFCDTAACLETGAATEVTLAPGRLAARRVWFAEQLGEFALDIIEASEFQSPVHAADAVLYPVGGDHRCSRDPRLHRVAHQ